MFREIVSHATEILNHGIDYSKVIFQAERWIYSQRTISEISMERKPHLLKHKSCLKTSFYFLLNLGE